MGNAKCAICNRDYEICNSCKSQKIFKPWRSIVDSEQFERYYESEDVVYCKDPKQQKLYLKHHAKLADVFYSEMDDKIVFVFWRENTKELYQKWKHHKLV